MSFKKLTTTDIKVLKMVFRKNGATTDQLNKVSESFGTSIYKLRKKGMKITRKKIARYDSRYTAKELNLEVKGGEISSPAEVMLNDWIRETNRKATKPAQKVEERAKVKKTTPKAQPPKPKVVAKPRKTASERSGLPVVEKQDVRPPKEIEVPVRVTVEVGRKKPSVWQRFINWITQ